MVSNIAMRTMVLKKRDVVPGEAGAPSPGQSKDQRIGDGHGADQGLECNEGAFVADLV